MKRNHDKLQTDVYRRLKKLDYLAFLMKPKNESNTNGFEMSAFTRVITHKDISAAIRVPVDVRLKNYYC